MNSFYDASAFAKAFALEDETEAIQGLLYSSPSFVSGLTLVEVASALCRMERLGEIAKTDVDEKLLEIESNAYKVGIVSVTRPILKEARALLRRQSLKASDAIQLATCLALRRELAPEPLSFLCFDNRLTAAARAEGAECLSFGP